MRYLALVCDYDGTIAADGRVSHETVAALERVVASGRKLVLVTGRELEDLLAVFPQIQLFDIVIAENGALMYRPSTKEEKALAAPPPEPFVEALRQRAITPLSVGRVIVATARPNETTVLEVIRDLGLELHVVFNKESVMVLPASANKATGLSAALSELKLSPHNAVGVGDAENDHAFLQLCECSAAVANALPTVKETADFVTKGDNGNGVIELIDQLLANDLADIEPKLTRHHILLGTRDDKEIRIKPYGSSVLLAGSSGSGKSTLAIGLLERLDEQGYQFCIIDPEGDYETFEGAVVLGTRERAPSIAEVLKLLDKPETNVAVNLLGLRLEDRPPFFEGLFPQLQELRAKTGRPHWIVVDEAHHLLPTSWNRASETLPKRLEGMLFITVHPDQISPTALTAVDTVIAVGEAPHSTMPAFSKALKKRPPKLSPVNLEQGEALVWLRQAKKAPFLLQLAPSRGQHRRHQRKYAEGDLGEDKSFYFRGPEGKLNLRAQNLMLFLQLADGVDDETWTHHLREGDYSQWFAEAIKDDVLATETKAIEAAGLTSAESRTRVRALIEEQYTLPAASPSASTSGAKRKNPPEK